MTEKLLTGTLSINTNKTKQNMIDIAYTHVVLRNSKEQFTLEDAHRGLYFSEPVLFVCLCFGLTSIIFQSFWAEPLPVLLGSKVSCSRTQHGGGRFRTPDL